MIISISIGAFLIPYTVSLVDCGLPAFMLELALGQYMGTGGIEAWARLVPAFKGMLIFRALKLCKII